MYEAVHAAPAGESTAARLALVARDCGFDGVVVRNHGDEAPDVDADRLADEYDLDVVAGVEIRADGPEGASGYLGTYRSEYLLVALHGGTTALNRFGSRQPRVDVLAHPLAGDGEFDHVMARAAADNGVRVEINFGRVLRQDGGPRVRALQDLRRLRTLIEQYDTPFVVTADARSHLALRTPRDLVAIGEQAGFDAEQVRAGLREWGRLVERNRERLAEAFLDPGVWAGRYAESPWADDGGSGTDDDRDSRGDAGDDAGRGNADPGDADTNDAGGDAP